MTTRFIAFVRAALCSVVVVFQPSSSVHSRLKDSWAVFIKANRVLGNITVHSRGQRYALPLNSGVMCGAQNK